MTNGTKRVERHGQGTELSELVNELRCDLVIRGYAFGALFVGMRGADGGTEFGFLFADTMPQAARMQLLEDMQKALDASKESFRI